MGKLKPSKTIGKASHGHSFVRFEHRMLAHPSFMSLSAHASKALLYLASQYKGNNNGDLCAVWKLAKQCGWSSNGSLQRGIAEAERAGFIIKTRQGGRNRCSLYALAWFPIDHCDRKHDWLPTNTPPNLWLENRMSEPRVVQFAPRVVQSSSLAEQKPTH